MIQILPLLPYKLCKDIQNIFHSLLCVKNFRDIFLTELCSNLIRYIDYYTTHKINYYTIPFNLYKIVNINIFSY